MVVYGDILFIENFIIGAVLIYITGCIFKESFSKKKDKLRFLAGSIMCGAFSLVIFLPVRMPMTILLEVGFAVVLCYVVFRERKLWQKAGAFILVSYCMGGTAMGLLLITKNQALYTAGGIYTGDMKAGWLALFVGFSLFTAKKMIQTIIRKKFYQAHRFCVKFSVGDFFKEADAFLDTGNGLLEPISGKPVAVAAEELWQEMEKVGALMPEKTCLIPYEAIGSKGLLQGVRAEYIEINGKRIKGCVIAKSDGNFCLESEAADGCKLLLSRHMTES